MTDTVPFAGRIVLLGHGTIGRCIVPMLRRCFSFDPAQLHAIESQSAPDPFAAHGLEGATYRVATVERDNLDQVLGPLLRSGDLLLNVSMGVDSVDLIDWCHSRGVLYVDTSIEPWEDTHWNAGEPMHRRTEYAYHQRARQRLLGEPPRGGPTAVVTHGANPGLVSHFAKAALLEVAESMGLEHDVPASREDWGELARRTGTRVIHISERDTQRCAEARRPGEFVNTWSIPGFVEEASMPAEMGWGTHEKRLPPHGREHAEGPCNAIYIARPAANVMLRSWVPEGGPIIGLALPHSESVTLSDYLTVREGGRAVYRPTVAFVYLPCDAAVASLHETVMRGWDMSLPQRVVNEELVDGRDELGVLLLGHGAGGWWYGSQLSVAEARRILPGHNPTAIQVAAGALAAAAWAVRNPERGYCEPEDLPHQEVLDMARPWLGTMASRATDWNPLATAARFFPEPGRDPDDPWQFGNFLVT
jgi:homospermidine synthase